MTPAPSPSTSRPAQRPFGSPCRPRRGWGGRIAACLAVMLSFSAFGEMIWVEAEAARATNIGTDDALARQPGLAANLSGGQWLRGKVENGLFAEYDIDIAKEARFEFYVRKFWMHGAFRWRMDDRPWIEVASGQRILNSVQGTTGVPLSWIGLGYVGLAAGKHVLRVEMLKDVKYPSNAVFGYDCFVLSSTPFSPDGLNREGKPAPAAAASQGADFGRFIPRTMALLESSSPAHRTPVRIQFYGQSIIASGFADQAIGKYLREKYPNAVISMKNNAIGGYMAPALKETAWQDLYPECPDLVVFHAYGGEKGELEEIFANLRRYTTAEVLTWTHHVDNYGPGVDADRDASSALLGRLAAKYGLELADVRARWKEHLKETHLSPQDLLTDQIHLNPKGGNLLGECLVPHFRVNPRASDDWRKRIRTISLAAPHPDVSHDPAAWQTTSAGLIGTVAKPLRLAFTGNRVDLTAIPVGNPAGSATILLDGKAPSTLPATHAVTRCTNAPGAWWPAIRRVVVDERAVPQEFTVMFRNLTPDGKDFVFEVTGAVSGPAGTGKAGTDFTSPAGIRIAAGDVTLAAVYTTLKKALPPTFEARFSVRSMSLDRWHAVATLREGVVKQETVVHVWDSGPHVLEIIPDGNGPVGIGSLTVHEPEGVHP